MKKILINSGQGIYKHQLRPILFRFDSESIHEKLMGLADSLTRLPKKSWLLNDLSKINYAYLSQEILGIKFSNPIGLSAGFDYEAKLYPLLGTLGFGFGTVGTATLLPYDGNPKPRLGRLVKSQSLMVNKGLKNPGLETILKKLEDTVPTLPLGLSIGATNSLTVNTVEKAIEDIVSSFEKAEAAKANFNYYELNISCPNLINKIDFYSTNDLHQLVNSVTQLKLTKPLFIKMPIERTNAETFRMLAVLERLKVAGVIFGNLQKNRHHPTLYQHETTKYLSGSFSGKPTQQRSEELIELTYRQFPGRFFIIGSGGVFSAEDAYRKIRLGANLIQLVTGLIFEGPWLPAKINLELPNLLKRDGYNHIAEAVGTAQTN